MAKKTITGLLDKIDKEVGKAHVGVEEYASTLEDTCVITDHLYNINKYIEQLKELI